MTWIPDFLKNLGTANYGMWDSPTPGLHADGSIGPGEGGVDIGSPGGTPVYAIADGQVVGRGYWKDSGHGVVTTRVNVPGAGLQDLYYQHIQIDPSIQQGMSVTKGQYLGTVDGFQAGNLYNEVEMGFNAQWGQPWGINHPGPWVKDPRPWLNALLGTGPDITGTTGGPTQANTNTSSPINIAGWAEKAAIFVVALLLVGFGSFLLFKNQLTSIGKKAVHTAEIAAVA